MGYLCIPQGAVVQQMITKEEDERDVSQGAPRGGGGMDVIWPSNFSQVGQFLHHYGQERQ